MHKPNIESAEVLARLFEHFDFGIETDDFLLYELGRLIEDDRASFEDEEFRRVIDEGIREHIEERIDIRAQLAARLRTSVPTLDAPTRKISGRTIRAIEDTGFPLHNVSLVVRTYTAYVFRRLQDAADQPAEFEGEARTLIERWHNSEILREEMTERLRQIGGPAVGPLADLLFDNPEDRMSVETALDTLGSIRTSSSARVLAHIIAEPVLPEDLEIKAYAFAKALWPLHRNYMLYTIAQHTHEDLSFRWFQLLVECADLTAVDTILSEVLVHAENPAYTEDLKAILELLRLSPDPEVEGKIVGVLNAEDTPAEARLLLEDLASRFTPSAQPTKNVWSHAAQLEELNRKYLAAAKLFDAGKTTEARKAIDAILKVDPAYPFAVTLKSLT